MTTIKKMKILTSCPYLIAVDDNVYFSLLQELQKNKNKKEEKKKKAKFSKDKTLHLRI